MNVLLVDFSSYTQYIKYRPFGGVYIANISIKDFSTKLHKNISIIM